MDKKKLKTVDKAAYIVLLIAAAAAAILSMVAGPFGRTQLSIGAALCACIIALPLLCSAIRAMKHK